MLLRTRNLHLISIRKCQESFRLLASLPSVNANEFITKARTSKQKSARTGNRPPIINCKRNEFNHYPSTLYEKFDAVPLASIGWHHKRAKGDYFVVDFSNDGKLRDSLDTSNSLASDSFDKFGISVELVKALERNDITKTKSIQGQGIQSLLSRANTLIAAETGCGKTLAFLLPILQQISEWNPLIENRPQQLNAPLGLIITPSRELAHQIWEVAKSLTENMDVETKLLIGGRTKLKMMNPYFEKIDLLVATLGALGKLTTTGIYDMNHVRHVILDEADTLLDESFSEKLTHFLRRFPFHFKGVETQGVFPTGAQLTLVSATMPTSLPDALTDIIVPESLEKVTSKRLHHFLPNVSQRFMRMGRSDKPGELLRLLKSNTAPVIVFSNKSSTCDWLSLFLEENNIRCVNLNGDMPLVVRMGKFEQFKSGQVNILSCTDVASRGLNTINVQHVINYDFPLYTADYIHRCGRTGREGSPNKCRVTNFISAPREIDLVQKIELSARKTGSLPNVDANISKVIQDKILRNNRSSNV